MMDPNNQTDTLQPENPQQPQNNPPQPIAEPQAAVPSQQPVNAPTPGNTPTVVQPVGQNTPAPIVEPQTTVPDQQPAIPPLPQSQPTGAQQPTAQGNPTPTPSPPNTTQPGTAQAPNPVQAPTSAINSPQPVVQQPVSPTTPAISSIQDTPVSVPWYRRYWIFAAILILLPGGLIIGMTLLLTGSIYRKKNNVYAPVSKKERVAIFVLAAIIYSIAFLPIILSFVNRNNTLDGYKTFTVQTGEILPVVSSTKTQWSIEYPDGMTLEDTVVSNLFTARGFATAEDGKEVPVAYIDFKPDSANFLGLTEEKELGFLSDSRFIDEIEQTFEQGFKTSYDTNMDFSYSGTTSIGADKLNGYYYVGEGTNSNGIELGARIYVGYDDDIRFSVLIMGQTSLWPEIGQTTNDEGSWWQHSVDSIDFN